MSITVIWAKIDFTMSIQKVHVHLQTYNTCTNIYTKQKYCSYNIIALQTVMLNRVD